MAQRHGQELPAWLQAVEADDLPELRSLAVGMRRDLPAIINGLTLDLRKMPLRGYAQNQLWCEIVTLACKLSAETQMLGLADGPVAQSPSGSGCVSSPLPDGSCWGAPATPARPAMAVGQVDHHRGHPPAALPSG
jgi:hypothetical protein